MHHKHHEIIPFVILPPELETVARDHYANMEEGISRAQFEQLLEKYVNANPQVNGIDTLPTYGQRMADRVAEFGGSWTFISIFLSALVIWMIINSALVLTKPFDPYPFILLNLVLSCVAALQAPVIMMSQNRQELEDRRRAKDDLKVNIKAEVEIRMLHEKLEALQKALEKRPA